MGTISINQTAERARNRAEQLFAQWPVFDQKYYLRTELGLDFDSLIEAYLAGEAPVYGQQKSSIDAFAEMQISDINLNTVSNSKGMDCFPFSAIDADTGEEKSITLYNLSADGFSFKYARAIKCKFYSCTFKNCDFYGADFTASQFINCRFENCIFNEAVFGRQNTYLNGKATFLRTGFDSCEFVASFLRNCCSHTSVFFNCIMDGTVWDMPNNSLADSGGTAHFDLSLRDNSMRAMQIDFNLKEEGQLRELTNCVFDGSRINNNMPLIPTDKKFFLWNASNNRFYGTIIYDIIIAGNSRDNDFRGANILPIVEFSDTSLADITGCNFRYANFAATKESWETLIASGDLRADETTIWKDGSNFGEE